MPPFASLLVLPNIPVMKGLNIHVILLFKPLFIQLEMCQDGRNGAADLAQTKVAHSLVPLFREDCQPDCFLFAVIEHEMGFLSDPLVVHVQLAA